MPQKTGPQSLTHPAHVIPTTLSILPGHCLPPPGKVPPTVPSLGKISLTSTLFSKEPVPLLHCLFHGDSSVTTVHLTASCVVAFMSRELHKAPALLAACTWPGPVLGSQLCSVNMLLVPRSKPGHLHSVVLAVRKNNLKWEKGIFSTWRKPK